jgi:murein DD-endopeptidase MepM/ murein hydrolase activator NlpD
VEQKANKHGHRFLKSDSKILPCPRSWQPPTFLLLTIGLVAIMSNTATSEEHSFVSSHASLCRSKQSSLPNETRDIDRPHEIALRALGAGRKRDPCLTPASGTWHTLTIKRGDTLSAIFSKFNMSSQLVELSKLATESKTLASIRPGQRLRLRIHDGILQQLVLEINPLEQLYATRLSEGFISERVKKPLQTRLITVSAKVDHSLFQAGLKAGLADRLIMKLAEIFGWDIDFALDIRQDDAFTVVFEQQLVDGKKVRNGKIVAAEFLNQGEQYQAYLYTNAQGVSDYYTPGGRSVRKPFLKTPVDVARISSRFTAKRRHPLLKRTRAHKGVDYVASVGTPAKSTGDGKIVFRGNKGGYGKTVIIAHGNRYTTLYAHLSRFARRTALGRRVKQGQVIGFIGKTGLATGPHLHYEFRVNGVHRNPLTIKLPTSVSLPVAEMSRFTAAIAPLQTNLDTHRGLYHTEKDDPQPHVVVAFGLRITN